MDIWKPFQRLEVAAEKCFGKKTFLKCGKILKDYKSEQNPLKILKRVLFGKVADLNLQLCRKINSITSIFQLICLPFKNNCLSKKTSKKIVRILKFNVYYLTQCVLLFIFSCCSWYI